MVNNRPGPEARVKAVFLDSTLHFAVAPDTPLETLCTLLAAFGRGHGDPLLIEVRFPPNAPEASWA